MRDLYHHLNAVLALASGSQAAAVNGATIDLAGYGSVLFVVNTGAISGAGDFGFKLQTSDTTEEADFADVPSEDILGTAPATMEANSAYRLGFTPKTLKRYVRLALTKAGGTSIQTGAVAILGHPARTVN